MEGGQTTQARQRTHAMADFCGVERGVGVPLVAGYGSQPKSEEAFLSQVPAAGGFVATRRPTNSALPRAVPNLGRMPFWVWRALQIHQAGQEVRKRTGETFVANETIYEAQIFVSKSPEQMQGPLEACWEMAGGEFLRTAAEKSRKRLRRAVFGGHKKNAQKQKQKQKDSRYKLPLTALLRRGNLVGGGFHLTPSKQIPSYVRRYLLKELCPTEDSEDSE